MKQFWEIKTVMTFIKIRHAVKSSLKVLNYKMWLWKWWTVNNYIEDDSLQNVDTDIYADHHNIRIVLTGIGQKTR